MNKRIRTIPLPYRNVGKCAEKDLFENDYIAPLSGFDQAITVFNEVFQAVQIFI